MAKILKITGSYGYAGTEFEREAYIRGDETEEELEQIALEEVMNQVDYDWEVIEEDDD